MPTVEELEKELAEAKAKAEENVKALQKKLSEKDVELKKVTTETERLKTSAPDSETHRQIETLTKTVTDLTGQIGELHQDKQKELLAQQYPDILPDLLIGKSAEEREIIVNKQRAITLRTYDEKPSAHAPVYRDVNAVNEAIDRVKSDRTLNTEAKLAQIRELKLKKPEL